MKKEKKSPANEAENKNVVPVADEATLVISEELIAASPPPVRGLSRTRIDEMRNQLGLLQEFVSKVMIRGEHYGIIPGTSKPTLLKAGAEFLREAYGFEVRSQCVERKFTPAEQTEQKKDYIEFTYRVELLQDGRTVGICEGSCNNYERRYLNLSPFAVLNTIQKMAQKRAYVGAVISATRSSNIFTQDLEDQPELAVKSAAPGSSDEHATPAGQGASGGGSGGLRMATPGQARLVWARLKKELELPDGAAREFISKHTGKAHSRDLTSSDVETLLGAIDAEAAARKSA
ncbi:MAG: hypothetical protein HY075_09800 [Deltaproteobacteria bacterium]|nr:hypothetical protein [Deltaproteobacteria bacterium]